MVYANTIQTSGLAGELSPKTHARADLPIFAKGYEQILNWICEIEGTLRYRNGAKHVLHTRLHAETNLIPFQFTDEQSYLLAVSSGYCRFIKDTGIIVLAAKTITAVTKANPGVVTAAAHGYSNGNEVVIDGVEGMTELNGRAFVVANVTANTFSLQDQYGNNVDTTGYTTYTGSGESSQIYEIAFPYTGDQIFEFQYAQNADTMYLTHRSVAPNKLTRTGHTSWTVGTYARTADPFGSAGNYPRAVRFYGGRIYMAGTNNHPSRFWGSRGPDSTGNSRYDDYTTGTDDDYAVIFNLNPNDNNGQVDVIQWISGNDRFLVMGTFSDTQKVYGGAEEQPITPTSITVKPLASVGTAATVPISDNKAIFYISRDTKSFQSIRYNFVQDGYTSYDHTEITYHLKRDGFKQAVFQRGAPDILWLLRKDGVLLGLTYKDGEVEPGWFRHTAGGGGVVESIGQMLRADNTDQLFMTVKRTINGQTFRSMEYLTDEVEFLQADEFFESGITKAELTKKYKDVLYERQKASIHLDMATTYDGSDIATMTLTPGAVAGNGVTFTAGSAVFTSDMVGRELWGKYNDDGSGGGRGVIASYVSGTEVTVDITSPFDSTAAIAAGNWYLTATSITNLHHLEGETLQVITDGATHPDRTVVNGAISLDLPASVVHVGYSYLGFLKSMNYEWGAGNGPAQTKVKNIERLDINFLNAVSPKVGVDLFNLEELAIRDVSDEVNRPPPPFTGVKSITPPGGWGRQKHAYIIQDKAQPCIVRAITPAGEAVNE